MLLNIDGFKDDSKYILYLRKKNFLSNIIRKNNLKNNKIQMFLDLNI